MAGVSLTLRGTTGTGTVSVVVGSPGADTDAIKTKVQAFVDQYNSTIDFIRGKLDEDRVVNPTTDADRAKGVLRGDPGLTSLLTSLRASVADVFSGRPSDTDQLSEAGVSTGATTGSGTLNQDSIAGKLTLDATKLTERLAANFNGVKSLFTSSTGSYDTEGLSQRLDRFLTPWLTRRRHERADHVVAHRRVGLADLGSDRPDGVDRPAPLAARGGAAAAVHLAGDGAVADPVAGPVAHGPARAALIARIAVPGLNRRFRAADY